MTTSADRAPRDVDPPAADPRPSGDPPADPPAGPPDAGRRAWWVAAVTGAAIIVAGAFSTVPGLLQDPLHREFAWSRGEIGLAASANMVLYGLTAPFAAAVADRLGLRRVVVAALAAVAAGALLTTAMTAAWQFVAYWGLLVGLGTGSLSMTLGAVVTHRWFVAHRGLVTGLLSSGSVLGQMVFLPGLAWIIARHDWRPALACLALLALAVVPLVVLLLRDHPADLGRRPYGSPAFVPKPPPVPGAARRALTVLRGAAGTTPFWVLAGAFAICGATTNGIMWTHFVPAAHDHGMPAGTASGLLALIGVFTVVGTVIAGRLTDRMDARRLLAVTFALRGLLLLSLPVVMAATVTPATMVFVVAFGLLDLATVPPVVALCRRLHGADGAIVFGWIAATHQVGAAIVAFLAGVARDAFGDYTPVWVLLGAACAVGALLSCAIHRPAPPGTDTDEPAGASPATAPPATAPPPVAKPGG
ncbi:MFS transporter [Streptomyces sp. ST2-7A]|uniref:MFS transporter n=1 Tax=Streptomyces sp. ST2-7A TaxID=2907214 RepID=UPI001F17F298|nr:MFS transporter [Streptomyces sp. ST2-7A]MCE7083037.1 MFS transporter [Streptomyces sp. ST2-7A]